MDLLTTLSITMMLFLILSMTYFCTKRADRICSEFAKGNSAKYRECLGI